MPDESRGARRALVALVGVMGLLAVGVVAVSIASQDTDAPVAQTGTTDEPAPTAVSDDEAVTGSSQVGPMPDDWSEGRVTEGPGGEEALRLLEGVVAIIGPERASIYNGGDALELRVVLPTPEDRAVVDNLQPQTAIPLRVEAVSMSEAWLVETMGRLAAVIPESAANFGADLEAGRLFAARNLDTAADQDPEVFAQQIYDLLATYLPDGIERGMVAEGMTPEQAIEITVGRFN